MNIAWWKKCRVVLLLATTTICSCSKDDGAAKVAPPILVESAVPAAPAAPVLISTPISTPAAALAPTLTAAPSPLAWAEVIDLHPDPTIVTNADLLARITATGLPWRVRDNKTKIEFLLVPPGTFMMGLSPSDEEGQKSEKPAHQVTITKAFYLGRTEVTQEQWERIANSNPSAILGPSIPVHRVRFQDFDVLLDKFGLRLPTEAEWEYACRAGVRESRYGDLDRIAAYEKNAARGPQVVGQRLPNALGFQDMLGNVMEWCSDWYSADYYTQCQGGVTDPTGPPTGTVRVQRGGSWAGINKSCRASYRFGIAPDYRGEFFGDGVRLARTP